MKRSNIEELQQYAITKGGILISTEYKNVFEKLFWSCQNNHVWTANWNNVKHGNTWCPACLKRPAFDILELQNYAKNKNGLLLSEEYKNAYYNLKWQCDKNHIWYSSWSNIKKGHWCHTCCGQVKPSIKLLQSYAVFYKGLLLSQEYKNNNSKLLWKCEEGHIWEAHWNSIKDNGTWCPKCSGVCKPNIQELKQFAFNKNGYLLSNIYKNNKQKLSWKCNQEHIWEASWHDINQGTWCSECSSFKTEKLCRDLLEQKLNIPFIKIRFIYNNKRYEFDGYNKEHKIAFEYHGIQHYKYPNYWHKTEEEFLNAKQRDKDKEQYCKENNIKLLIIPYTANKNLEKYINSLFVGSNFITDH